MFESHLEHANRDKKVGKQLQVFFGNYSVNAQLESEFSFGAFTLLAEVNPRRARTTHYPGDLSRHETPSFQPTNETFIY